MNIGEYQQCRFTEPEANNWLSIIFIRGEYQGPQNNGLKYKNTDSRMCSFADTYAAVVLIISFSGESRGAPPPPPPLLLIFGEKRKNDCRKKLRLGK